MTQLVKQNGTEDKEIQKPKKQELIPLSQLPPPASFLAHTGMDESTWRVMTSQLYPSASDPETIVLVLDYSKIRKLDPFSKCLHIIPMWDSKQNKYVDRILPGVALYEITAHRTGQFAGKDAAVFGPIKNFIYKTKGKEHVVKAPEWARVKIKKLVSGQICEFESDEIYYEEFAAIAKGGYNEGLPNENWREKPRMMLGKCALAAALRLAFPEEIGNEPTSEEMEGRAIVTSDDDETRATVNTKDLRDDPAFQAVANAGRGRKAKAAEKPAEKPTEQAQETVDAEVVKEEKLPTQQEVAEQKSETTEDDNKLCSEEDIARLCAKGVPNGWLRVDVMRLLAKQFKLPLEDAACITIKQGKQAAALISKYPPSKLIPEAAN